MKSQRPAAHLLPPRRGPGSDPRSLAGRPSEPAELLGQVWTPPAVADQMAALLRAGRPARNLSILDPAVGPATFPEALARGTILRPGDELTVYDVDAAMVRTSAAWAEQATVRVVLQHGDYLEDRRDASFDLAILNPPYVRQEWIASKEHYRREFRQRYGLDIPGTSNLYVYFLTKVLWDLKEGGRFVCLVYDSWQATRFGSWLQQRLRSHCDQLAFTPVPDQPFRSRLIDATIISGRRRPRTAAPAPKFKEIAQQARRPSPLDDVAGLAPVGDLFRTKRGLRLKQADFFLIDLSQVADTGATPFLKKSAAIKGYSVPDAHPEAALLLTAARHSPGVSAELQRRLQQARQRPSDNVSILTWVRERPDSWFLHRDAPHAPFLFNYYLRNRPRHLYNPDRAYSDNFYGLVPHVAVDPFVALALLNSTCFCVEIMAQARNQGSGLAKVQLFEYRRARLPDWRRFTGQGLRHLQVLGSRLAATVTGSCDDLLRAVDDVVADEFGQRCLRPKAIAATLAGIEATAKRPREYPGAV